jgi:hypothetical protein
VKQIFAAGSVRLARHNLAFGVLVGSALILSAVLKVVLNASRHYASPFQFQRLDAPCLLQSQHLLYTLAISVRTGIAKTVSAFLL